MTSKFMTKKQAIKQFIELYSGSRGDRVLQYSAWSGYVDVLCADKQISQTQYDNWTNPFPQ